MTALSAPQWAQLEMAHAQLGDLRRCLRAASLVSDLASRARGTITRSFRNSAKREAAYRFVESQFIRADALLRSVAIACLLRIQSAFFIVALDFCYLAFLSASPEATGPIGTRKSSHAQGLISFNALALTPQGTPLGLCFQHLFARPIQRRRSGACRKCKKRWKSKPKKGRRFDPHPAGHDDPARRSVTRESFAQSLPEPASGRCISG